MRLNLVLLLAVLASALYLVSVQYESRRVFTELDKTRAEAHRLESEFDRLQVEKRAQATPARVEKLAREKLQMRQASPAITTYVTYASQASSDATVAAAGPGSAGPSTGSSAARKSP
jgi:cell division protein FtsL